MRKSRVRVEAKKMPHNATRQDRERSFVQLMRIFKRKCNEYGILNSLKKYEFFERKTDVRRRKEKARQMTARQKGVPEKENSDMEW